MRHERTVHDDGARAADPVLAPEVGAGEGAVLAEGVGKRLAGVNAETPLLTVHAQGHISHG